MQAALAADESLGEGIFRTCQRSGALKAACELATLLVDDGVCLLLLIAGWFGALYLRSQGAGGGGGGDDGGAGDLPGAAAAAAAAAYACYPEAIAECYLLFMSWASTETFVKLLVRRPRPALGKQKELKDVMIPGDQFSFPSGHSLRAFAIARVALNSAALRAAGLGAPGGAAPYLLLGAGASALSRIGLGRHTPLDVACGSLMGLAMGELLAEPYVAQGTRWRYQLLCASYFTAVGVAAALSARARAFFGFVVPSQVAVHLCFATWGSWIYSFSRFARLGHHDFAACGLPQPEAGDDLGAAACAALSSACLLLAAAHARGWWLAVVPVALASGVLALELLGQHHGVTADYGIAALLSKAR